MSLSENRATITKAFARFRQSETDTIRKGMVALAEAGLDYLMLMHDYHAANMAHTEETNTTGWAVGCDGVVVASGFHDGTVDDLPGTASRTASNIVSKTRGWVAVILSEMEGWYRVDYEEGFLYETIINTKEQFQSYFKRVSV